MSNKNKITPTHQIKENEANSIDSRTARSIDNERYLFKINDK
jgi:hypothetical protein